MRYIEFKKMWQDKFNALPMKAAFDQEQFERMMAEWGLTTGEEDLKKICCLAGGAFCLKSDAHLFKEFWEQSAKARAEFLANEEQLKDALIYEFDNQECGYTWNPQEAVDALFDKDEQEHNELLEKVLPVAWKEYTDKLDG